MSFIFHRSTRIAVAILAFQLLGKSTVSAQSSTLDPPSSQPEVTADSSTTLAILNVDGAVLKTVETTSVAAQAAGVLNKVHVREGDRVKIGEPLGTIESTSTELQLERSKVALEVAQRNLENTIDIDLAQKNYAVAQNEFDRALESNKVVSDVYPAVEVERLKLVRDRAELEVSRARFAKEIAKLEFLKSQIEHKQLVDMVSKHTIGSPVSGMVVAIEKRTGEWVEPGAVAVRIVEIDRLRIEGFLKAEQADNTLLNRDAQVEIMLAGKKIQSKAKLVFISPEVNPINSQVRVFLDIDNSDGKLRPGLRASVWFPTSESKVTAAKR